jgi:hypothetical protein
LYLLKVLIWELEEDPHYPHCIRKYITGVYRMAWNSLHNKDNGHSIGLAYLTDVVADEGIRSIVPGTGIGVNNTNPLNPTVSNTGVLTLQGKAGGITLTSTDDSLSFNTNTGIDGIIDINANELVRDITVDGTTKVSGQVSILAGSNITLDASAITDTITINASAVGGGVSSLQGLTGALTFSSSDDSININQTEGGTIIDLTSNGVPPVGDYVASISEGTNTATGAIKLLAGEGTEITYDTDQNAFTFSSLPYVGIYNLLTAQNLPAIASQWVNPVINLTPDAQTDSNIISYDAPTGTWTVLKDGVYFLNFSAGIIQNDAVWTFGSFCQCFIVVYKGSEKYNICNSLTPSPTSGVGTFNGQVFGYIPLQVGTTITCGFQWYLTSVGATVAQFQPRTTNINNGTNFNWAYVKPLTA